MKLSAIAMCLPMITGCSVLSQLQARQQQPVIASYVTQQITIEDGEAVAADMAAFLASQLPPAHTTLELEPSDSLFHEGLIVELTTKGFGVIQHPAEPDQAAVPLRYFVTTLDGGLLVRMKYSHKMAGRYYPQTPTGLSFGNAFAVREATQ